MAVISRLLPLVAYTTFAGFFLALMATPTNALAFHAATVIAPPAAKKALASPTRSPSAAVPTGVSTSIGGGSSGGSAGPGPNKKLLLAWAGGPINLEKYVYGTRVGGMYTWSPWCPDNAKTLGVSCFKQLWGFKQESSFAKQADHKPPELVFGFDGLNQVDQANISAQDVATLWNSAIRPLKRQGAKLVSPAITSTPSGKMWIQDMMKACGSDQCAFDFIALHWSGTSTDEFKAYVDKFWMAFGKPLIISEYACQDISGGAQCTKDQTNAFHRTMGTWFDQHEGVAMYAPFGLPVGKENVKYSNQLLNSDGSPNDLGKWYLDH